MKTPIKQHFFNNIAREFDTHVRQSIPLYGDFIDNLRANIISNHHGERVLDVCGSTGLLGVDLFNEGFDGEYVNVDGSPKMFGGANVSERQGYYQMEDGTIVKELNYVVPVWTNNSTVIKAEMQQETVGIEYNNKFYLI